MQHISRRGILAGTAALALARPAIAQGAPIKIGLMLPGVGGTRRKPLRNRPRNSFAAAAIGKQILQSFLLN